MIKSGLPPLVGYAGFSRAFIHPGQQAVHIEDENKIPDALCKIERTPRKKDIAVKLKAGEEVPGATLKNPVPRLAVYLK
jgi:hypothetical protein